MNTDTNTLIEGLEDWKYHQLPQLSSSGARTLLTSPKKFAYDRENPRTATKAMELGTVAHTMMLGTGTEGQVVQLDGEDVAEFRSNAAKAARDAITAAGNIPVKRHEFDQIEAMIAAAKENPDAKELIEAQGQAELTALAIDPRTGVGLRARLDKVIPRDNGVLEIVDAKTAQSIDQFLFAKHAYSYGYHIQEAFYRHVYNIVTGRSLDKIKFTFIVMEKTAPYDTLVCSLDPDSVHLGHEKTQQAIERFRDCMESGVWPARYDSKQIIRIPDYAFRGVSAEPTEEEANW